jgi:hypothetical protein
VAGRLARARALLAKRLARHGLAPAAGALAVVLAANAAPAGVPAAAVSSAVKAAGLVAAGQATAGAVSAQAAALTEEVLKAMLLNKLKAVTAVALLLLGVAGFGAGLLARSAWGAGQQDRPGAAPPAADDKKPERGEPVNKKPSDEGLRPLTDKVLKAHGGEDKLRRLKAFTLKVKQTEANGKTSTVEHFVQLPDGYRVEVERKGEAGKTIHILGGNGMRHWRKDADGKVEELHLSGLEPSVEYWLDRLSFFGPRAVLRLTDADHRLAPLDEIEVEGRAAVGVGLTKEVPALKFSAKMFFDKETGLLVKEEQGSLEIFFKDYKRFDGIPVAQKKTEKAEKDRWTLESEVLEFKAVDKLDAKLFENP